MSVRLTVSAIADIEANTNFVLPKSRLLKRDYRNRKVARSYQALSDVEPLEPTLHYDKTFELRNKNKSFMLSAPQVASPSRAYQSTDQYTESTSLLRKHEFKPRSLSDLKKSKPVSQGYFDAVSQAVDLLRNRFVSKVQTDLKKANISVTSHFDLKPQSQLHFNKAVRTSFLQNCLKSNSVLKTPIKLTNTKVNKDSSPINTAYTELGPYIVPFLCAYEVY